MTEKAIDLDQHRGMASQKATDLRRLLAGVEANVEEYLKLAREWTEAATTLQALTHRMMARRSNQAKLKSFEALEIRVDADEDAHRGEVTAGRTSIHNHRQGFFVHSMVNFIQILFATERMLDSTEGQLKAAGALNLAA